MFQSMIKLILLGFLIAKFAPIGDRSVSLGIFLCGVCPGGGFSNIYTYLLGGDVSLSITMTFLSTIASLGVLPAYVYTLGTFLMDDDFHITIPYINLLQISALVVVPLLIGIGIKYKFPKVAFGILRALKPILIVFMVVFMVVGIYSNLYIFRLIKLKHMIVGCCLPYFGYILGGSVAAIARQPWARVKTIALETGMQNYGVALIIVMLSFPPPIGDIASVAAVACFMMTPIPAFLVTVVYLIYNKCTGKYEPVRTDLDVECKVKTSSNEKTVNGVDEKILTEKLSTV